MKEVINPGTPVVGPYSPGIKIGNAIYISGQGYPKESSDISEQTYQALNNIKKIIISAEGKVSDIVATTVYLKDMTDFGKMNSSYKKFFEDSGVTEGFPSRTTVEVSNLPVPAMKVEINATALIE
ncbi:MAG: RidA family protein [Promethearchaeota archaeon]|nr:MAG: RidA family protein [Candidatus Lokiarchaeota archaeon]